MTLVLSIIHVVACILIIVTILLQSGRGGGLGAGLGGASAAATQIFGGRGAGNFLSRGTVWLAATFMCTSLGLAYFSSRPNSIMDLSASSGAVDSQEDTIIEEGRGEFVPADGSDVPTPTAAPAAKPAGQPLQLKLPDGAGADGQPIKLNLQDLLPKGEDNGAAAPKVEIKPTEPKAEEKPAPKAEKKPEAPKAAKPAPKAAKPAPKAEEKPAPKAEEQPAPKAEEKPAPKAEPTPKAEEEPAAEE